MIAYLKFHWQKLVAIALLLTAAACNPTMNWREVRGDLAPYSVLMPAKPSSFAREVDLNGVKVMLNMTAAEVSDVNFAVGSAAVADPAQRNTALLAMQSAMVANIHGEIRRSKQVSLPGGAIATDMEVLGQAGRSGAPVLLAARFVSHGNWVIQAIAIGPEKTLTPEVIDTFRSSLTLH